jgi:hypothetical protein
MSSEDAAPCRHAGAPPEEVIERVAGVIEGLADDEQFLASRGVTAQEYARALPAVIERIRGRKSASNAVRRGFLSALFDELRVRGIVTDVQAPVYGDDTVYRLTVPGVGSVAVIQKGCPDGAHSSVRWTRPDWATECYLWWLCSSTTYEPGVHVWKGLNRLRTRFFSEVPGTVDGVIFHNELCGAPERPCPKSSHAITVDGREVPPPCIYVMPQRDSQAVSWNWNGGRETRFGPVLLGAFGISAGTASAYIGHVGFQLRGVEIKTVVSSHSGPGRAVSHRS